MNRAEQAALRDSARARELGGLTLFECPRHEGRLKLTPACCARMYGIRAQVDSEHEAYVRLWACAGCPVGAANEQGRGVEAVRHVVRQKPGTVTDIARRAGVRVRDAGAVLEALLAEGVVRLERRRKLQTWWPA